MANKERILWAVVLFIALATGMVRAQGTGKPAELPPANYAGLQYVDTKGCVFLRAGTKARPIWVPRVTAGGRQICGYPPSGKRVAVVGESGADKPIVDPSETRSTTSGSKARTPPPAPSVEKPVQTTPPAPRAAQNKASPPAANPEGAAAAGFVVAVGSFGVDSNVKRAASVVAANGYPVDFGRLRSGQQTLVSVFAGPFDTKAAADAALQRLRSAGFKDAIVLRR